MITIFSTVVFCAVGSLVSMNVMNKQFDMEYPAEISYIALNDEPVHQQHLQQIEGELQGKQVSYTTNQVPIKYIEVASSTSPYPSDKLAIISFSDYQAISKQAGYEFTEKPLKGIETLNMRTSSFEGGFSKPVIYTLKQDHLQLHPKTYTQNVVLPYQLVWDEGLVVSDELFTKLSSVTTGTYTGFYTKELEKTIGMVENLVENGKKLPSSDTSYFMTVSGTLYENQMTMFKMMLFVALLIGAVFFIAAGSFLYFRLYADLEYDSRQYLTIKKVGLTDQELNKIVTRQLALLFFVPILVAFVHSAFAFTALQSFYVLSIATEMIIVLAGFLIAQLVYFYLIRYRYLKNLKKALI